MKSLSIRMMVMLSLCLIWVAGCQGSPTQENLIIT
jgi:hypothetical protein